MAQFTAANQTEFIFQSSGGPDELRVAGFTGSEGISQLFHFELELAVENPEMDFESMVGSQGRLLIRGPAGERHVNGIISRIEQLGEGRRFTTYTAELVPMIWLLSHRQRSRIFQEMTIPEIIKKVLQDAGIPDDLFEFALQGRYQTRAYCVQYQESELNFISRLMEEEGIFYFFVHTEDKHLLVMGDSGSGFKQLAEPDVVIYHEPTGDVPTEEYISAYRYAREIRPDKSTLRDYNFTRPDVNMEVSQDDNGPGLEVYEFPGDYQDPEVGLDLALVRLQELQTIQLVGAGKSDCRRFVPGYIFRMDQHARSGFNQPYLLTQLTHFASQPQVTEQEARSDEEGLLYQNEFECIPLKYAYRPPRLTPKPTVLGTQTAIVVGPAGEEIHTDEHGRVRVWFHWDRNDRVIDGQDNEDVDKCSCWMRVSQLWAGAGWGAMYIPRIGQEVIVDFLEGDPDRPIILGRVYHGQNTPPYALPDDKTKSTIKSNSSLGGGGSNELRFEDLKGSEEVYLHGEKDWNIAINNNESKTVGVDITTNAGKNITRNAGENISRTANKNISNKAGEKISTEAGDSIKLKAGGSYFLTTNLGIKLEALNAAAQLIESGAANAVGALQQAGTGLQDAGSAIASGDFDGLVDAASGLAKLGPVVESTVTQVMAMKDHIEKQVDKLGKTATNAVDAITGLGDAIDEGDPMAIAEAVVDAVKAGMEVYELAEKVYKAGEAALEDITDLKKIFEDFLPKIPSIELWAMKNITAYACMEMNLSTKTKDINLKAEKEDINLKAKKNINFETEEEDINIKASKKKVNITSKEEMEIKAEDKKLTIEAGKDKVFIESAKQIFLKCGSASISLAKSGNIVIKGKKINITGSGPVQVKGTPIKLN